MSTLFDLFGLLGVVLHGLELVAQSVLLGSTAFMVFVITPRLIGDAQRDVGDICAGCRQVLQAAALAVIVCVSAATAINAAVLAASLPGSWRDVAGFVLAAGVKILAATAIGRAASLRSASAVSTRIVFGVAATLFLSAALADSHAVARLQDNGLLLLATAAHALGAALWLGGLPCFWVALRHADSGQRACRMGRRFSVLALTGVALILMGAVVFIPLYIGAFDAVYGTAYGAMAVTKSILLATAAHALGAALWLGGLPCFWVALRRADSGQRACRMGRRFSVLAITGVALILMGAVVFIPLYIGAFDAVYGTAYGAMAVTKSILLAMLLLLGLANFRAVRRAGAAAAAARQVQRFVEVEMGIGVAVLLAAASITSMPPALDLRDDRVTYGELVARFTPARPRLVSPDHATLAIAALQARLAAERQAESESTRARAFVPGGGTLPQRNAEDRAWSEYNHHWAGVLVMLMGFAALAQRTGHAPWAKHWPLLLLLLAGFLLLRADPEVWPMGEIGLIESLKDPEVLQHRLFSLLIVAFALFEWGVRTGRIAALGPRRVFPLLTALGGTLLLTHSHALGNVKEEVLVDLTHLPIAVLGIGAGWARWLEIEAPDEEGRWAGWLWPACFVLIGLLLLGYRES